MTYDGAMQVYLRFLQTRHAARLLGGTLVGRLPTAMAPLVIMLFVRHHGGDYTLGGALTSGYVVAMAAGQPILGRIMDRTRQPYVMIPSALAAAAGFALPAATGLRPLPITFAAVLLAGFATPPLEAGLRALWPTVLGGDPERVQVAYGLDAAAQELLFVTGPLLVIAAAAISPEAGLLLTALLGVVGTLSVVVSKPSREWRGEPGEHRHWAGPLRSSGLRTLLISLVFVGFSLGVISVAAVTYGSGGAAGLILAANAGGALTGGLVAAARGHGDRPDRRLPWLILGLAVFYLPLALTPVEPLMLLLAYLAGIFLAPALGCCFTLVDSLAPRGTVTEAFAWIITAMAGGTALGSAAAGWAGDRGGAHAAFACAGLGGVAALVVLLFWWRTPTPAKSREQAVHLTIDA
jgi:MFS family permease